MRQFGLRNDSWWPHNFYCNIKTPHKLRREGVETCDSNISLKSFQVPLNAGRSKEKKRRRRTKKGKLQSARYWKDKGAASHIETVAELSRTEIVLFAMDVLRNTFPMINFNSYFVLFFQTPSEGQKTKKRKTVIKSWNGESWYRFRVGEPTSLCNCGFC